MNWITDTEMRKRDGIVVSGLINGLSPDKGYGMFRRSAEQKAPGLTVTYNLAINGFPDLVVSGTNETSAAQHKWILDFLISYMLEDIAVSPTDAYVDLLNQYLAHMGMGTSYKVVKIDTEQFYMGYGFSVKRYYESIDVNQEDVTFLQVVEVDSATGCFPAISNISQVLFATVPFGQKEPSHANLPPVQNLGIHPGQN